MKIEQVLQLVNAVSESALTELKLEEDDIKLCLKKTSEGTVQVVTADQTPTLQTKAVESPQQGKVEITKEPEGNLVKSPLVGTFYAAPAEGADPFVKPGDKVEKGQVLAIVEAMKLMNEIESDYSGEVAEVLAENGQPVEYGQPLFAIR